MILLIIYISQKKNYLNNPKLMPMYYCISNNEMKKMTKKGIYLLKVMYQESCGFYVVAAYEIKNNTLICEYAGDFLNYNFTYIEYAKKYINFNFFNDSAFELINSYSNAVSFIISPISHGNIAKYIS